jgi:hypothetical protein
MTVAVAPPREPETATQPRCPRCGTPHEPNQEYCLECGLRLPGQVTGVVPRLGLAWRRRLGWYPGDWVWPSLLALVIAALAGIGAAAFVSHDKSGTPYVTRTSPAETVIPTTAPEATTPVQPKAKPKKRAKKTKPPAAPVTRTLKAWPTGQSGWTVILQSVPAGNGRTFALAQARAAQHSGVTDVGILDSSQYSSLHPGYYVLFSGVYNSFDDANTASTTAHSHGYPRAYARRITP